MMDMPMDGGAASLSAATSFLAMWIVMMVAMMLPSVAPTLWRYRRALRSGGETHATWLAALLGAGYFFAWAVVGFGVYPLSIPLKHAGPVVVASIVIVAGVVQLTPWKSRQLAHCRTLSRIDHAVSATSGTAWRHGLLLGRHCILSCAALMASLLAIGMTDVRVMAVVTTAITLERLAPGVREPIPTPAPPSRTAAPRFLPRTPASGCGAAP